MDELRPGREGEPEPDGILGDMALCPQVATAQAPEFSRTPEDEMHLLTIHGILHLLGYDHAEPRRSARCSRCRPACWRSGRPFG